MPSDPELMSSADAREFCDTLLRHFPEKLSEWEDGFARSLLRALDDGAILTLKQKAKLDEVMERVAGGYGR